MIFGTLEIRGIVALMRVVFFCSDHHWSLLRVSSVTKLRENGELIFFSKGKRKP